MIAVEVTYELGRLQKAMQEYYVASQKDAETVIRQKMGTGKGCLSTELFRSLQRRITPGKGSIRSGNIERMRSGDDGIEFFHARSAAIVARKYNIDSVGNIRKPLQTLEARKLRRMGIDSPVKYELSALVGGKRLNVQALVAKTELNLRESSRNFVPHAVKLGISGQLKSDTFVENFMGERLTGYSVTGTGGDWVGKFTAGAFGSLSSDVAEVLLSSRGQACLAEALQIVEADIRVGIDKYLKKNSATFFNQ